MIEYDFSFLKYAVGIGPEGEIYSLLPDGTIREINGFGVKKAAVAVDHGNSPHISWLLTNSVLTIYFKKTGLWWVKDLSLVPQKRKALVRSFIGNNDSFWLCLGYGNDLYVLNVRESDVSEFVVNQGVMPGIIVSDENQVSIFGEWNNNIYQYICSANGESIKAYPLFSINNEKDFFLGVLKCFDVAIDEAERYFEEGTIRLSCESGIVNAVERIFFIALSVGDKSVGMAVIKMDSVNRKLLFTFPRSKLISQINMGEGLELHYFRNEINREVFCLKYDNGEINWGVCNFNIISGEKISKIYLHEIAGLYTFCKISGQVDFLSSLNALDFSASASEIASFE